MCKGEVKVLICKRVGIKNIAKCRGKLWSAQLWDGAASLQA